MGNRTICGPSQRWVTGEVEFWCSSHAYGKTMYPTDSMDAEEVAEKHGWKHLKNGSWRCPWCVGVKCSYLKKFEGDWFYSTGVYFKPHTDWNLTLNPELAEAMDRAFKKKVAGLEKSKVRVRKSA